MNKVISELKDGDKQFSKREYNINIGKVNQGRETQTWALGQLEHWAPFWAPPDFEVFTKNKTEKGRPKSFPDFEVFFKKKGL